MGRVIAALKATGLYNNSIVVFSTDNGGGAGTSSVFPWRGGKETLLEGGVRSVGFVHSPLIKRPGRKFSRKIYITDWLATLLTVAGLDSKIPIDSDSFNMWPSISWGQKSPRKEIVLNLDQDTFWNTWSAAIITGKYKFLWGQQKLLGRKHLEEERCNQELYNLKRDPKEENDLMRKGPQRKIVAPIRDRLLEHQKRMVQANYPKASLMGQSLLALNDGVLSPGWC